MADADLAPVVDFHMDTLSLLLAEPQEKRTLIRREGGHVDIARLRQGNVAAAVFALFTKDSEALHALRRTLCMIDIAYELSSREKGIAIATSVSELRDTARTGRIAVLLSIENGAALCESVEVLRCYYRLGVRALTLVWNGRNAIADGVGETEASGRLTRFGKEVVKECNGMGILLDVSHMARNSFFDVLECSEAPIIASHSNARALCDHPRNLDDDQLRAISQSGGVVGVNFYPRFLVDSGTANLEDALRHIDYLVERAGSQAVGLGSDFDGIEAVPEGLEDVSRFPALAEGLARRGYDETVIRGILGGNWLRVLERVIG